MGHFTYQEWSLFSENIVFLCLNTHFFPIIFTLPRYHVFVNVFYGVWSAFLPQSNFPDPWRRHMLFACLFRLLFSSQYSDGSWETSNVLVPGHRSWMVLILCFIPEVDTNSRHGYISHIHFAKVIGSGTDTYPNHSSVYIFSEGKREDLNFLVHQPWTNTWVSISQSWVSMKTGGTSYEEWGEEVGRREKEKGRAEEKAEKREEENM